MRFKPWATRRGFVTFLILSAATFGVPLQSLADIGAVSLPFSWILCGKSLLAAPSMSMTMLEHRIGPAMANVATRSTTSPSLRPPATASPSSQTSGHADDADHSPPDGHAAQPTANSAADATVSTPAPPSSLTTRDPHTGASPKRSSAPPHRIRRIYIRRSPPKPPLPVRCHPGGPIASVVPCSLRPQLSARNALGGPCFR